MRELNALFELVIAGFAYFPYAKWEYKVGWFSFTASTKSAFFATIASAIAVWQPIASMVTTLPEISRSSNEAPPQTDEM